VVKRETDESKEEGRNQTRGKKIEGWMQIDQTKKKKGARM